MSKKEGKKIRKPGADGIRGKIRKRRASLEYQKLKSGEKVCK